MSDYCVYKHTTPSGKVYIGITSQEVNKRWKNGKGYKFCTAFNRAIDKYGWDNITHEIIKDGLDKETACELEQRFISAYKSSDPRYGYNLTSGGEHYEPNHEWRERLSKSNKEYYKRHPEAKERISKSQIGRKTSDETKKKQSEAHKRYYKEHPEMAKACGNSFRGKTRGEKFSKHISEIKSKKIRCVEIDFVFDSIKQASETLNVPRTGISNALHGRARTCGGYTFEEA